MEVPFGNLKSHYRQYKTEIDAAVSRVLESGYFVLGPEGQAFEEAFSRYLGGGYTAGCASGTDAIYLALAACGVGPGDEVLVVAHTAVPTICAIAMTGAVPVFVDVRPDGYVMDESDIEGKITEKTRAIIPVHLYGQMADMDTIMTIASRHGLKVVEDCAQCTGARYKGRMAGTIGDYGAWSFYPSKNIGAFGDGGAVSTNSNENHQKLLMLRNYGQSKRYYHDIEGVNSRLDEIQAAILACQLPYIDEWNERRREIAARYDRGLAGYVETPRVLPDNHHVYHLYVIQTENRDDLIACLLEKGVQALIHYPVPAHLQNAYRHLGYSRGSLPHTEALVDRIVSLPMYPGLTDQEVDFVIECLKEFVDSRRSACSAETASKEPDLDADRKSNQVATATS
ncbi:MAG: DegT/DnrJ/EryC1/StrS family aminotransferase [Cyanobacteria bacterium HKST-UBA02]|nr:DegT/DnrJ/EryC1/StrS family aminotransferase [Cyanobacteria bacterium HKST-UBA02]